MTSNRPYLIRALYEWILDNAMTPHILVNARVEGVDVPPQHVHDGRIVLNVSPSAVHGLAMGNDQSQRACAHQQRQCAQLLRQVGLCAGRCILVRQASDS